MLIFFPWAYLSIKYIILSAVGIKIILLWHTGIDESKKKAQNDEKANRS